MRVLVTGATGFLGGRIAHAVAGAGYEVRGFVRDPSRWLDRPKDSEAATGDVVDSTSFRAAARDCGAIVHTAALVRTWVKDREAFDRINVGGLRNAIDAAADAGAKLLYTSSFIALGPTDGRTLDEEAVRAAGPPHNDYERTKWAADRLAREAAAAGRPIVRLYPGVVYGPGALTEGNHVVQNLVRHAHGKVPGMLGAGDRRLCFSFVDDVAAGFVAALERAGPGDAYILGGENRTLADLFAAFAKVTGVPPPRLHIPYTVASIVGKIQRWRAELTGVTPELTDEVVEIYRREWAYDSSRAIRELGYRVTPFEEGVARTVAWLVAKGLIPERQRRGAGTT